MYSLISSIFNLGKIVLINTFANDYGLICVFDVLQDIYQENALNFFVGVVNL